MAGLSGNSVGFGIGLTAKGPDYANIYLAKDQQRQRDEAAKAKAKQDEDKSYQGILKEIKINGVHRLDEQAAKDNLASFVDYAAKERTLNPNNWLNNVQTKAMETMQTQAQLVERKKKFDDIEKAIENQKTNGLSTEAENKYYELMRTGSMSDLEKLGPDPTGTIGFDPQSKNIFHLPLPNLNVSEQEDKYLKNPDFKSALSSVRDKTYKDPKGGTSYFDTNYIPKSDMEAQAIQKQFNLPYAPPSLESVAQSLTTDPAYNRRKLYEFQRSGVLPENLYSLDPAQQQKLYKDALLQDLSKRAGVKTTRRTVEPFAPKEDNGLSDNEIKNALKNDVKISDVKTLETVFSGFPKAMFGDMKFTTNVKAPTTLHGLATFPSPIKVTAPLVQGTIDAETGKPVEVSPVDKDVSLGAIVVMPINKNTGEVAKDYEKNELVKDGNLVYKAMIPAVSVEKVSKTDKEGNVTETNYTKPYYIPAESMKNTLVTGKNKIDAQPFIDDAERRTSETYGVKPSIEETKTKVTPETKTTTTEKLYVVGGKAYKESALKKQGYDISTLEEYK